MINNLKQLLTDALFHSRYKLSALNILSYGRFTVKPPGNIDLHGISNLLYLLYPVIIDIRLHLMNGIARVDGCNCCLVLGVFEY